MAADLDSILASGQLSAQQKLLPTGLGNNRYATTSLFVLFGFDGTVQHFCSFGMAILGQHNPFASSIAEMLYCPKVFVVGHTNFWDSTTLFCCTDLWVII